MVLGDSVRGDRDEPVDVVVTENVAGAVDGPPSALLGSNSWRE